MWTFSGEIELNRRREAAVEQKQRAVQNKDAKRKQSSRVRERATGRQRKMRRLEEQQYMSSGREEIVISSLHIGNRIRSSRSSSLQVTSALHLILLYLFFTTYLSNCLIFRPTVTFNAVAEHKKGRPAAEEKRIQRELAFLQQITEHAECRSRGEMDISLGFCVW